jgi:cyanophycin synthetase
MEFRQVRALRGPNIWANFPVLEALVDLGELNDTASDQVPGFNDRLMAWLPTLIEHRCSIGERGGFLERLQRGTYPAHILEHVTLELQSLAGSEVGYGRARAAAEDRVYRVVVEYEEEELGGACLEAARELILAALTDRPYDLAGELKRLRELAQRVRLDPSTEAIVRAARRRRIPVFRLGAGLVQLGQGGRQHRLLAGRTDRTGALAESIAQDAEVIQALLRAAGVPVPEGRAVTSAEDAWAIAQDLGVPVVVTRRYGERRPFGTDLTTQDEVVEAYQAAADETSSIRMERRPCGAEWRLLVVGGRVVAAIRREPGPSFVDVTDQVHAEVADRAVLAAAAIGLDMAGVELTAADIGRPLEEQGGVVTAVIAAPDLEPHLRPVAATARPVGEAVAAALFPEGETGRIPVVAVTGVNGKTTTTRLLAHILTRWGRCVGMTCTDGIYIAGRRIDAGDCSGPRSARGVLLNPRVEAAVLETARGGILREGLGFDRCNVAVVTNIADGDHLGMGGIETPEQLARVKRTVVDVVARDGAAVLKADDPLVAAMAEHCRGSVVYFARDGGHPVVVGHRAANGRAVFARDGRIILADDGHEIPLVTLDRVPLTHGGRVGFQIENALAAAAAAWALGVPCEVIRAGLETFVGDMDGAPVRFNVIELNGATFVLDYGHNVASLTSVIEALDQFRHQRRVAVYSGAGDRRDCDMIRQGELLAEAFDRVVLFEEESCVRGRKPGEMAALFRRGLAVGGRVREILEGGGNVAALDFAIRTARPGDLVLVQVDRVESAIELVRRYQAVPAAESAPDYHQATGFPPLTRTPAPTGAAV